MLFYSASTASVVEVAFSQLSHCIPTHAPHPPPPPPHTYTDTLTLLSFYYILYILLQGPAEIIRGLCSLGAPEAIPQLVILDIPDDRAYYQYHTDPKERRAESGADLSAEDIAGFVAAYKGRALKRMELRSWGG